MCEAVALFNLHSTDGYFLTAKKYRSTLKFHNSLKSERMDHIADLLNLFKSDLIDTGFQRFSEIFSKKN